MPIITTLAEAEVKIAPSSYYATKASPPSARQQRDEQLIPQLKVLWTDNYRVYGARKLWKAARRAGHDIGWDQVARLMQAAGIEGVRRGRQVRTTRPDLAAPRHDPETGDREIILDIAVRVSPATMGRQPVTVHPMTPQAPASGKRWLQLGICAAGSV